MKWKWLIKNPAPLGWKQDKWGDYHFGRSLTKYLERMGQKVVTQYEPEWNEKVSSDIVLVLRGKYPYVPQKGAINIMWNISHPETVTIEEYNSYDIVLVASHKYAEELQKKLSVPVFPFLQCTDHEEFYYIGNSQKENVFVFVGNTREVERPCVIWASEIELPISIWGRGWKKWVNPELIRGDYYENNKLGKLYSSSVAVLNDHWPDMLKYGYINNRIFDVLACKTPIISDFHEELYKIFPNEVLYYRNKKEFIECVEKVYFGYPSIMRSIDSINDRIVNEFSFERRARDLVSLVKDFQ